MPNNPPEQKNTLTDIAILSAIIVTGSILIILGTSKYGVGLTGDSISYIALSKNILKDLSFNDIGGDPFVLWPPGYSITLALVQYLTSLDAYSVLLPYNLVCYAFLVVGLWRLLKNRIESSFLKYAVLAVMALSPAVIRIYVYAFAEVAFLPLLITVFLGLERIEEKKNAVSVIVSGVLAMLLSIIKYTGVLLIPLLIWAVIRNFEGKKRLLAALFSLIVVPLPWLTVLVSNYFRTGTLMGYRGSSIMGLGDVLLDLGATFLYWVFPLIIPVVLILTRKRMEISKIFTDREKYFWGFTVIYLLANIGVATDQAVDDLNNRLLVPVFFTMLLPLTGAIEGLFASEGRRLKRILIVILLCLIPLSYIRTNIRGTSARIANGAGGITSDEFYGKFPKDIERIKSLSRNKTIFTNNPAVFYYLTGFPNKSLPRKKYYNSDELVIREQEVKSYLTQSGRGMIFIFTRMKDNDQYSIEEIKKFCDLKEEFSDREWKIHSIKAPERGK